MKNKAIVFLVLILLFNSVAVSAGVIYTLPCQTPESVYKTPYADTQFTTVYTPWLRNFHLMNEEEYNMGRYGGEACQQVRNIEISPVNSDILYFVTDTTGVWKTTDGGKNWYNTSNNLARYYGGGLLCDLFDENKVYTYLFKDGAYRSINGGKTWELIIKDESNYTGYFTSNLLAQDAKNNLYIAAGSGIYILPDGASEPINLYSEYAALTGDNSAWFTDIYVSKDGQQIYATGNYVKKGDGKYQPGLYISRDAGKTWEIKNLFESDMTVGYSITVNPEDPNNLFLSAGKYSLSDNSVTEKGLYESKDGGATFEKTFVLSYENIEENTPKSEKHFYKLRFGPKNGDGIYPLYMVGSEIQYPLRRSLDMGKSFTPMHGRLGKGTFRQRLGTEGDTGWWPQGYAIDMNHPGIVYFACAGIYKITDGNLEWKGSGFSGASVTYISMNEKGNMFLTLTDVGSVVGTGEYTKDSFPTFQRTDAKILTMSVIDPNDANHIIGFSGESNTREKTMGIVESFDGGVSFCEVKEDAVASRNTFILKYDTFDKNTIYSSEHTSHDNGKTWQKNEKFILDVSNVNPQKMVAVQGKGAETELFVSEDGGKTWKFVNKPGFTFIHAAFDVGDENIIWYSYLYDFGKIDLSTGVKTSLASKFSFPYFDMFAQNPKNPMHIIVPTRPGFGDMTKFTGVCESTDGGESFHVVPGFWAIGFFQRPFFSTTTDEVFITSHAGTFIYDYKKYWEFLDSKITVKLNDKEISFSKMPQIVNNRAMVPMRDLFEMLGATISWDEKTQTVTAKRKTKQITLTLNSDTALINNKPVKLDSAPYIDEGKTMIPLRFASEALDINVGWDAEEKIIVIKE